MRGWEGGAFQAHSIGNHYIESTKASKVKENKCLEQFWGEGGASNVMFYHHIFDFFPPLVAVFLGQI